MPQAIRRVHDAAFKTKRGRPAVVVEALKGTKTLAQLSSEFGIHAQQITDRSGGPVKTSGVGWNPRHLRVTNQQTNSHHRATRANLRSSFFSRLANLSRAAGAVENDWQKKLRTS